MRYSRVATIIHYGPSRDIEDYVQETGRAGRDGSQCDVILYYYPGCLLEYVSPSIKEYCKQSTVCRREFLLTQFNFSVKHPENFLSHCCCDVCGASCNCHSPCPFQLPPPETTNRSDISIATDDDEGRRVVTSSQREQLRLKLHEFREHHLALHGNLDIPLYVGVDIALGLTRQVIESVVNHCEYIHSVRDLEEKCIIWHFSNELMEIIDDILDY